MGLLCLGLTRGVYKSYFTQYAYVAVLKDETPVTRGSEHSGGGSYQVHTALRAVDKIYNTEFAIALVLKDGAVIPWGDKNDGGDPNDLQAALRGVDYFYSIQGMFGAV